MIMTRHRPAAGRRPLAGLAVPAVPPRRRRGALDLPGRLALAQLALEPRQLPVHVVVRTHLVQLPLDVVVRLRGHVVQRTGGHQLVDAPARACIWAVLSWARCTAMPTSPISSEMPDTASPILVCASAAV